MISSTRFLLGSFEAVRGRPLRGWSWMLVLPSLKRFTHRLTLLAPMHTSPYTRWSLWWISAAGMTTKLKLVLAETCEEKNGNFEDYASNRSQNTQKKLHSSSRNLVLIIYRSEQTFLTNRCKVTDMNFHQNSAVGGKIKPEVTFFSCRGS